MLRFHSLGPVRMPDARDRHSKKLARLIPPSRTGQSCRPARAVCRGRTRSCSACDAKRQRVCLSVEGDGTSQALLGCTESEDGGVQGGEQ